MELDRVIFNGQEMPIMDSVARSEVAIALDACEKIIKELPIKEQMPSIALQPMVLYATSTPQGAVVPLNWKQYKDGGYDWNGQPSALGQIYINIKGTNGSCAYIAVPTESDLGSLTWKQI